MVGTARASCDSGRGRPRLPARLRGVRRRRTSARRARTAAADDPTLPTRGLRRRRRWMPSIDRVAPTNCPRMDRAAPRGRASTPAPCLGCLRRWSPARPIRSSCGCSARSHRIVPPQRRPHARGAPAGAARRRVLAARGGAGEMSTWASESQRVPRWAAARGTTPSRAQSSHALSIRMRPGHLVGATRPIDVIHLRRRMCARLNALDCSLDLKYSWKYSTDRSAPLPCLLQPSAVGR